MKSFFAKLLRMIKSPSIYIEVAWFRYVQKPALWPIEVWWYRNVILPQLIKKVGRKEKIKVLFLAMSVAYWKYDTVYRRMAADFRFEPIIMPAMRTNQSLGDQLRDHDELMEEFSRRGYNIVPGYDKRKSRFVSPKYLKADIIFYTHPYSGPGRLRRLYDFWAMRRSLICYMPYFFAAGGDSVQSNHPIQNIAWQLYYPYEQIRPLLEKVMDNRACNVKIPGYVFGEELGEVDRSRADLVWRSDVRIRIIWAPHHSIDNDSLCRVGTFLMYCDAMKELAKRYSNKIMIAFKPHPVLYSRLVKKWGREKTDEYYNFWAGQENTMIQQGAYLELFKGSDAMIHDCDSFQREYLEVNKPCLFLCRPDFIINGLDDAGKSALAAHYSARSKEDIVNFIENVVFKGVDPLAGLREDFYNRYLKTPNGRPFSENVVSEILKGLGKI